MANNSASAFFAKVLKWISSTISRISTDLARSRDQKLKRYRCSLTWSDGEKSFLMTADVKAENESQARQLSNAEAARDHPVLKPLGSNKEFIPPYIKDPNAALALWKVVEMPLTDVDRDRIADGTFGPAAALGVNWSNN
jgi:hypothetical protein